MVEVVLWERAVDGGTEVWMAYTTGEVMEKVAKVAVAKDSVDVVMAARVVAVVQGLVHWGVRPRQWDRSESGTIVT